jgi:hypothetical protein
MILEFPNNKVNKMSALNKEELLDRRSKLKKDRMQSFVHYNMNINKDMNYSKEYSELISKYIEEEIKKIDKQLGI